jgi:hypothetical protein
MYGAQGYQKKSVQSARWRTCLGVEDGSYFNLPTSEEEREKSVQLCLLKASFTSRDGLSGSEPKPAMIQLHFEHPQAAKVLFSSQTSSLAMRHPSAGQRS